MRCPECKAANEAAASFCSTCGLILFKVKSPQRRAEDHAQERRRSADLAVAECRFCKGRVPAGAVRCMHCSQFLDEELARTLMQRRRAQINYASWVLYLLGLFALLIFKPVGFLAIAAGLALSILYYALPADPISLDGQSFFRTFWQQLRVERVAVPVPAMRKRKLIFVGTPLLAAIAGFLANYLILQRPMNQILEQNAAYRGMKVSTHYQYWIVPGVLVYDLRSLDNDLDPLHVHTALLQYAQKQKTSDYERVELHYRGEAKLWMDGTTFKRIGEEYGKRNFKFALFDFTKMVKSANAQVELKDVRDPNESLVQFHRIWYANDELARLSKERADAAALARPTKSAS